MLHTRLYLSFHCHCLVNTINLEEGVSGVGGGENISLIIFTCTAWVESLPRCTEPLPPPLSQSCSLWRTSRGRPVELAESSRGLKVGLSVRGDQSQCRLPAISLTHSGRTESPACPALLSPDHVGDVVMRVFLPGRAHTVPAVPQYVPREVAGRAATQSSSTQLGRAMTAP